MSIAPIVSSSEGSVEQKKVQYELQYNDYSNQITALINNANYAPYFAADGDLKSLKEALVKALVDLRVALSGVYDEAKIDQLMQALGTLLAGNATLMSLQARITAYETLLRLKEENKVTEEDYAALLAKLNSADGIQEATFLKLLNDIAPCRKSCQDFLNENESTLGESKCAALKAELGKSMNVLLGCNLDVLKIYNDTLINLLLPLRNTLLSMATATNEDQKALQSASLSMKVIQANNSYRDIESQLISDEILDNKAKMDENLKRFRDEGIWGGTTSKRREEILQEQALQKARDAEQK